MSMDQELEERSGCPASDLARERLLTAMPVTERRLLLAGISTPVLDGGEGPPVVLLHGPGEFAANFAANWVRVIPDLMRTHRVIAPDLPGHGASEVADGKLDATRVLAWLGELIEQTCSWPPALVGRLLGAAIAARFASDHGDMLGRLVLVDGYGLGRYWPTPRFTVSMIAFAARPTEGTQERVFRQCVVDLDGLRSQMGELGESLETYALDRARTPGVKAAVNKLMRQFGVPAMPSEDLARIAIPTTLIWGRRDRQVRLQIAEAASNRYGWPLHVIDNAADDPAIEQPEAFLRALHIALGSSRHTKRAKQ